MFNLWVRKICWGRESLPTPVFLSGEFHGQKGLEGYKGFKELDMTEQLTLSGGYKPGIKGFASPTLSEIYTWRISLYVFHLVIGPDVSWFVSAQLPFVSKFTWCFPMCLFSLSSLCVYWSKFLIVIRTSVLMCMCVLVSQLCLTLCHPTDCSPPGSSVQGVLQARILEWVAIAFSIMKYFKQRWVQ